MEYEDGALSSTSDKSKLNPVLDFVITHWGI